MASIQPKKPTRASLRQAKYRLAHGRVGLDVPSEVVDLLKALRLQTGLTNGQLLIQALTAFQNTLFEPKAKKTSSRKSSPVDDMAVPRKTSRASRPTAFEPAPQAPSLAQAKPMANQKDLFGEPPRQSRPKSPPGNARVRQRPP